MKNEKFVVNYVRGNDCFACLSDDCLRQSDLNVSNFVCQHFFSFFCRKKLSRSFGRIVFEVRLLFVLQKKNCQQ